MGAHKITIQLTDDEALVFYDWLTRLNQQDACYTEDQAEERVLFDLEAMLENILVAPLQVDYAEQLARARANVRDTLS